MESGVRPRKLTKRETKSANDVDKVRMRGRPRLDSRDQTAPERRRTQIRVAQRAYRQRKESTISGLSGRAAELEQIIDKMNQAFCKFSNTAVSEGFVSSQPSLGRHLAATKETFLQLSHDANIGSDKTQGNVGEDSIMPDVTNNSCHTLDRLQVDIEVGQPFLSAIWSSENPSEPSLSTFGLTLDSSSDNSTDLTHNVGYEPDYAINSDGRFPPSWMTNRISEWDNGKRSDQTLANLYASTFPHKFIKPPTTYSFQEPTFARRLFRLSLENGLRLLKDPRTSPSELKHRFEFTFCFSSRAALIDRLARRLAASSNENLEAWSSPRFHIGGAGLHYPRPEINNNMAPPPETWSSEPIGPRQWKDPEDVSYKDWNIVECIKRSGLDGEWFDANDVEQYLRTKGVFLDSGSSYTEIPLSAISASQVSSVSPPSLARPEPFDGSLPPRPRLPQQKPHVAWMDDTTFPDIPMSSTTSFEDFNDPVLNDFSLYPPPHDIFADTYPSASLVRKATLDVGKFLRRMIREGVCLGRAPGYRRHAVDKALSGALLEAF